MIISKETWLSAKNQEHKDALAYDIWANIDKKIDSIRTECPGRLSMCNDRIKNLENRKWWNATASGIGGIIGGFAAMMAKALWK